MLRQTLHIVRQAAVNLELPQYSALHDFFSATLLKAVVVTSCCPANRQVVSQVAHAQTVHTVLGDADAEEASLLAVVELMLDMTESSVAFCWELGAGDKDVPSDTFHATSVIDPEASYNSHLSC